MFKNATIKHMKSPHQASPSPCDTNRNTAWWIIGFSSEKFNHGLTRMDTDFSQMICRSRGDETQIKEKIRDSSRRRLRAKTRIFVPKERRKLASYEVAGTARQTIASWKDAGKILFSIVPSGQNFWRTQTIDCRHWLISGRRFATAWMNGFSFQNFYALSFLRKVSSRFFTPTFGFFWIANS